MFFILAVILMVAGVALSTYPYLIKGERIFIAIGSILALAGVVWAGVIVATDYGLLWGIGIGIFFFIASLAAICSFDWGDSQRYV